MNQLFTLCCHYNEQKMDITLQGNEKLIVLLCRIQAKTGIPPKRQLLMMDSSDLTTDESHHNRTLGSLHLSNTAIILVMDKEPDQPKEFLTPDQLLVQTSPKKTTASATDKSQNETQTSQQSSKSQFGSQFDKSKPQQPPAQEENGNKKLSSDETKTNDNSTQVQDANTEVVDMEIDKQKDDQDTNANADANADNDNNKFGNLMDDPRNFMGLDGNANLDFSHLQNDDYQMAVSDNEQFDPFDKYEFDPEDIQQYIDLPETKSNQNQNQNQSEQKNPQENKSNAPPTRTPMKYELLSDADLAGVKHLLWGQGANEKDVCRWYSQGFGFVEDKNHNNDIRFGLLQLHGGPCGVLAPVHAYMLKEMLFNASLKVPLEDGSPKTPILPSNEQRETALVNAIVTIMYKCSIDPTYMQWIVSADIEANKFYKINCRSVEELKTAIMEHSLRLLYSKIGVVCFVFSIILSRSATVIMDDVDDKTQPLILPQHGHCSQELVNLMITGSAHTNIHDDNKYLGNPNDEDCFVLKGIGPNQEIGFLTTLEPMRLAKVGDHFKCPEFPIWVVGSSSHYTVLFSLNKNVSKISDADKKRQDLKRAFHKYDPDETGIINFKLFPDLLKELKCDINAHNIKQLVDPDNTGHVLWFTFERAWEMIENQAKLAWQCSRCTLYNKVEDNFCAACVQSRGVSPLVQKPHTMSNKADDKSGSEKAPTQFYMYLYNGLKATKKDRPTITKLTVYDEAAIQTFPSAIAEELTGLIRTKWPFAVVEYDGPFAPKVV